MEMKILFNSAGVDDWLSTGWGVSFLIGTRLLFDTGEKGEYLLNNIRQMGVELDPVKDVVISHDHWDHTGGLWDVFKDRKDIQIYSCPGFSDTFKEKVQLSGYRSVESDGFRQVAENVHVTGEIIGQYKERAISEQAAVVETNKGLSVITGCAHPGIIKILDLVREKFPGKPFYAVFGGFHLMNKHPRNINSIINVFKDLSIKKAGPTHCSGTEAENIFKEEYGDNFLSMKAGETFNI